MALHDTLPSGAGAVRACAGEALLPPCGADGPLMVLRRGWAARCHDLGDGKRQISALFSEGDLCDPLWLSGQGGDGVIALTPVEAIPAPPLAERDLMAAMAAGARLAAAWTVNLGRKSALERLANLFCELFTRSRRVDSAAQSCEMPLSARDLADATGLTVQHIQRLLADLRTAGLARVARRRMTIPDFSRLARVGHFDATQIPGRRDWPRAAKA